MTSTSLRSVLAGRDRRDASAISSKLGRRRLRRHVVRPSVESLESLLLLSASMVTDLQYQGPPTSTPMNLTPAQVRHAYGIDQLNSGDNGSGTTIAIISFGYDPTIESDLHQFDSQFQIQDPTFLSQNGTQQTTALPNGSFIQLNENGIASNNPSNTETTGNTVETALDVEWAHAIAPGASIVLVNANPNTTTYTTFENAVNTARNIPGVVAVSISYGYTEQSSQSSLNGYFTTPLGHTGITFLAAAGDGTVQNAQNQTVVDQNPFWPASSPDVVSVGGTTLITSGTNGTYVQEERWTADDPNSLNNVNSSSGGPSSIEPIPDSQLPIATVVNGGKRGVADVSLNAGTAYSVYDSSDFGTSTPWAPVGGTSASTPQWAGLIALADQERLAATPPKTTLFGLEPIYNLPASDFNSVAPDYNQSLQSGYQYFTGLGTPIANKLVPSLISETVTQPAETAVYNGNGVWSVHANDGFTYDITDPSSWGVDSSDVAVVGDFDGNGQAEFGLFRGDTGNWYIAKSFSVPAGTLNGTVTSSYVVNWGGTGNNGKGGGLVPVIGDYQTGAGHDDLALYFEGTGNWYIATNWSRGGTPSNPGPVTSDFVVNWGGTGTVTPVPADYTGAGHADLAFYIQGTGNWYIASGFSQAGTVTNPGPVTSSFVVNWGGSGTVTTVPADYTGAGHADLAFYIQGTGNWYIASGFSQAGTFSNPGPVTSDFVVNWGGSATVTPIPGDYTGAGHADLAFFYTGQGDGYFYIAPVFSQSGTINSPGPVLAGNYHYTTDIGLVGNQTTPFVGTYDVGGNGDSFANAIVVEKKGSSDLTTTASPSATGPVGSSTTSLYGLNAIPLVTGPFVPTRIVDSLRTVSESPIVPKGPRSLQRVAQASGSSQSSTSKDPRKNS